MAATGFTPISLYYSTTASAVPTAGNLANGELALNIADMKLYAKNSSGVVTLLSSSSGATGTVSSVAVSGGTTGLTTSGGPITTSGTITLAGTLATANGGTNLTSFTANGLLYASSSSVLTTGSALTYNGSTLGIYSTVAGLSIQTALNTNQATITLADADGRTAIFRSPNSGSPNIAQIGTTTNHDLAVLTGNTERARFDSSGRTIIQNGPVGAGQTSSIKGLQMYFDATNNIGYIYSTQSGVSNYKLSLNGNGIDFNNQMALDTSGNLNIGTTSNPSSLFRLLSYQAGSNYTLGLQGPNRSFRAFDNTTEYRLEGVDSTLTASYQALAIGAGGYLRFMLGTAGGGSLSEAARITSSGAWSFGSSGTNTGTAGQVLTSQGSGSAPTWAAASGGTTMLFCAFSSTMGL